MNERQLGQYKKIKEFVCRESDCKLLSKTYKDSLTNLVFLCRCGNTFEATFGNFKGNHKRQCNICGEEITRKKQAHSYSYVQKYIEECGCSLVSKEYYRNSDKLKVRCKCGNLFYASFNDFKAFERRQCKSCGFKAISEKQRLSYDYVKNYIEVESGSGCKLLSDKYVNNRNKLKIQCKCGKLFRVDFTNFKDKGRMNCKKCSNITYWDYNKAKHYIEKDSGSGCKLLSKQYINNSSKLLLQCGCGSDFHVALSKFKNGKMQCNSCGYSKSSNNSKGEESVEKYLKFNSIVFIREQFFNGLMGVGGGLLRFDFAILDGEDEVVALVEYDGEFHFKRFYEEQNFEELQTHDKRKNQYCKDNNIPLLRIPYWDFDNIEEILDKWLVKLKLKEFDI